MNVYAILLALCSIVLLTNAYPMLSMPQYPAAKIKRNDEGFPLTDDEVLQLENLKSTENKTQHETVLPATKSPNKSTPEQLPDLERQLESANPNPTHELNIPGQPISTVQEQLKEQQTNVETSTLSSATNTAAPAVAKQYHGAARLAFGQNPEVLPTLSTASTTSATTTATIIHTSQTSAVPEIKSDAIETSSQPEKESTIEAVKPEETDLPTSDVIPNADPQFEQVLNEQIKSVEETSENIPPLNVGETTAEFMDTSRIAARRSSPSITYKSAKRLLQHQDGQYSAFDMAQYVFWTGDESGVARAVEELIERGLMTRENALKFLREIRMGIEYLERSYTNRAMPIDLRPNHIKKSYTMHPRLLVAPSTTTERMTIATEKPTRAFVPLWRSSKPLDSAATWSKLQQLNANDAAVDSNDYDDAGGRAKIAEFLYTEYTLEEILYKLAKVMFTQSLAHGSDEAQKELQKLTDFLEREGNLGVIPMDLQKKVLNTLLTALSDTLSEHPELLPAARSNLGMQYNKLLDE